MTRTGPMRGSPLFILLLSILLLGRTPVARAQYILEDVHDPRRYAANHLILPFAYYTPDTRFGGGFIWETSGLIQPQTNSFGVIYGDVNGNYGLQGGFDSVQIKPFERLFLDGQFSYYRYDYNTIYVSGNPHFSGQPPGANGSAERNHIVRRHSENVGWLSFRYLLPIGGGRDVTINRYVLENGIVQSGLTGGHGWNPLTTGRTYLQVQPFYELQTIETNPADRHDDENGLRFGLIYDNRDFPLNPSSGNLSKITLSRDFGLFNSTSPWTNISGEFTQFINLGRTPLFRQRVIAMDFWTSYSITWSERMVNGQRVLAGSPPYYDGAVLGGDTRLRGFAQNRFWDRAAVYASLELRLTPEWNPFANIKILKPADLTFLQWVVFGEVGRVSNEYSPSLLHHLKGDFGVGVRLLSGDTLVRFDVAASNEGVSVWAMLDQPF